MDSTTPFMTSSPVSAPSSVAKLRATGKTSASVDACVASTSTPMTRSVGASGTSAASSVSSTLRGSKGSLQLHTRRALNSQIAADEHEARLTAAFW